MSTQRVELCFYAAEAGYKGHGTTTLRVDEEEDDILFGLADGGAQDVVNLRTYVDADLTRLAPALREAAFVGVHLSAHGTDDEGFMADFGFGKAEAEQAGFQMVADVFGRLRSKPDFVVLSACDSVPLGKMLTAHVGCVIANEDVLEVDHARKFDRAFYRALGEGRTVAEAFAEGHEAVEIVDPAAADRLRLLTGAEAAGAVAPLEDKPSIPEPETARLYLVGDSSTLRMARRLKAHLYPEPAISPLLLPAGSIQERVVTHHIEHARLFPVLVCPGDKAPPESGAGGVDAEWIHLATLVELIRERGKGSRVPFFPVLFPGVPRAPFLLGPVVGLRVEPPVDLADLARRLIRHLGGRPSGPPAGPPRD